MMRAAFALVLIANFAGCVRNSAPGNDREAQLDPPAAAATTMPAQQALAGVDPMILQPQTMTDEDLATVEATACLFRMTEVGYPVFAWAEDGRSPGTVKLNGKLIPLAPAGAGAFGDAGLNVEIHRLDSRAAPEELDDAEFVVRLPGKRYELGFHGFSSCSSV